MTVAEYDAYFEPIATKLKAIRHSPTKRRFAHYHIEEVLTGLREHLDMTDFCLLLEDLEGRIISKADEAINDVQSGALIIARHVPHDDFAGERTAIDNALKLCRQVAARMIADKAMAIQGSKPRFLRGLVVSGFSYQKVGPLFDHCFGYRLEFQYTDTAALIIDPDQWDA